MTPKILWKRIWENIWKWSKKPLKNLNHKEKLHKILGRKTSTMVDREESRLKEMNLTKLTKNDLFISHDDDLMSATYKGALH